MKIIFIADFFVEQIPGGGELNNEEVIKILNVNSNVVKKQSHLVSLSFLRDNKHCKFIIANFVNLAPLEKKFIQENCDYIIYEHDHKYLPNRNPAKYHNFIAPKSSIINYNFYKNAKKVLCQTQFHKNIVDSNLNLKNTINLSGNVWSLDSLNKIKLFCDVKKDSLCAIMNSEILHKNTLASIEYCRKTNKKFKLIDKMEYHNFLKELSSCDTFVFFPKTPETLSRIVVEARMMNMKVITNNLVGASKEEWFKYKGDDLLNIMKQKRTDIVDQIRCILNEKK